MVNHTPEYAPIVQRAIQAYEGLMELYAQDAPRNQYFDKCLSDARSQRNGLQQRLANAEYLANVFKNNYALSIDHFLESHRGEYGPDMPSPDPEKARLAGRYLQELRDVMTEILRVGRALELGV